MADLRPGQIPAAGHHPEPGQQTAALVVACFALFTDMVVYGLAIPVLPLLPAVTAAGPFAAGTLFAGYAAAMIVVTPVAGRVVDRRGPRGPLLSAMLGLTAATLMFAMGGPFLVLLAARVLQGAAAGLSWVAALSLIAAVTPVRTRGRSMGIAMSMVSLGVLVGPPLAGILAARWGTAAPFLVAAGLAMADGALRVLFVRPISAATDDPAGPVAVLRVRVPGRSLSWWRSALGPSRRSSRSSRCTRTPPSARAHSDSACCSRAPL